MSDAPFHNGNPCECCEAEVGVQLYLDIEDNAVDLCLDCYRMLTTTPDGVDA